MKKLLVIFCFLLIEISFAMPFEIQNFTTTFIPNASASKMKDIISPTKNILQKADDIYSFEQKDYEVTLKLSKYRNLKSRNHTFLVTKRISLEDLLGEITNTNKTLVKQNILEIKGQ